jgi:hypothetical protein
LSKKNELNNINGSVMSPLCIVPHIKMGRENPVRFYASLRESGHPIFDNLYPNVCPNKGIPQNALSWKMT